MDKDSGDTHISSSQCNMATLYLASNCDIALTYMPAMLLHPTLESAVETQGRPEKSCGFEVLKSTGKSQ